ncbi:hypothetical protein BC831DRAFT_554795 [Entophlyctis helioformis]|nr:hypothetical protein BC831DRAFT_554795 [Entophlyctis helioformis]
MQADVAPAPRLNSAAPVAPAPVQPPNVGFSFSVFAADSNNIVPLPARRYFNDNDRVSILDHLQHADLDNPRLEPDEDWGHSQPSQPLTQLPLSQDQPPQQPHQQQQQQPQQDVPQMPAHAQLLQHDDQPDILDVRLAELLPDDCHLEPIDDYEIGIGDLANKPPDNVVEIIRFNQGGIGMDDLNELETNGWDGMANGNGLANVRLTTHQVHQLQPTHRPFMP